jgi:SNF2 family DNA or RNA helicase
MQQFMQILALVLRIRQCCVHMSLVPEEYRQRAENVDVGAVVKAIEQEEGASLLQILQGFFQTELVECVVCMNELSEQDAKILRTCQHVFCESCLNQISNFLCPLCRSPYSSDDMIDMKTAEEASKKEKIPFNAKKELKKHGRSPKFQAVLDIIDQMKYDEKGVIFSQWTSVLDLLEEEFKLLGHTYTRIGKSCRCIRHRVPACVGARLHSPLSFVVLVLKMELWTRMNASLHWKHSTRNVVTR